MADKNVKISFFSKKSIACPVCDREFQREELLSGSGRLIAANLSDELRRVYKPSKKYGRISPLNYTVQVCPDCLYAANQKDFQKLPADMRDKAHELTNKRVQLITGIFGTVNYEENRDFVSGAASYILAVSCYSLFKKELAPTFKRANCSLRAAWLLGDLVDMTEDEAEKLKYQHVQEVMYQKAMMFYNSMLEPEVSKTEPLDSIKFGPDEDTNWGYDGFLYVTSMLRYKMGYLQDDIEARGRMYVKTKRIISKLVGSGRKSKNKPTELINLARDLYEELSKQVKEIEEQLGIKLD